MSDGRGVYSIGAVARMLDLPVATIRNWEERYGMVVPERSAGGQRLYTTAQVEQLRSVADEVARGLPAADAHRLLGAREAPPDDAPATRGHPLVLIAERDRAAAELARASLDSEGYDVESVFTAAEAEERSQRRRPALAVVELMISGGQGAELCRRLKQQGVGAVVASSTLAARAEALAAGADAFLQKPVDPRELVATVHDLIAT